jgi:hypothetical protein
MSKWSKLKKVILELWNSGTMEWRKRIQECFCLTQYSAISFFLVSFCHLAFGFPLNLELLHLALFYR